MTREEAFLAIGPAVEQFILTPLLNQQAVLDETAVELARRLRDVEQQLQADIQLPFEQGGSLCVTRARQGDVEVLHAVWDSVKFPITDSDRMLGCRGEVRASIPNNKIVPLGSWAFEEAQVTIYPDPDATQEKITTPPLRLKRQSNENAGVLLAVWNYILVSLGEQP